MSKEIRVAMSIEAEKGNLVIPPYTMDKDIDMNGSVGGVPGLVAIATTAGGTAVDLSALTTLGWILMTNLDSSNNVNWGPYVSGSLHLIGRIKPGESALFRLYPGSVLRMIAETANVKVQIIAFDD